MAELTRLEITDYHKGLIADTSPTDTVSVIATNGVRDEQIPLQALAGYVGKSSDFTGQFASKEDVSGIADEVSSLKKQNDENAKLIETLLQRVATLENQLRMV